MNVTRRLAPPPNPAATSSGRQRDRIRWQRAQLVIAAAALLICLPLMLAPFEVERLASTITIGIAVLGLVVLTGWSGQISLGHGAFFGVGAYTTAILVANHGWPHLATLGLAALIGLVLGAIFGLPALRVTGIYLALVSLALATVFPSFVQHFESVTGGTQGMPVPTFEPWFGGLSQERWGYYVALAVAVPLFLLVFDLGRSRVGRGMRAMRDSEPAAKAMGVPVAGYKVGAFAVSGCLAAVAGALSVMIQPYPYVDPRSYTIALSIGLVTGLVVGGAGSVVGAVIAAVFLDRVPTLVTDVAHLDGSATNFFYGGLLILLMFVMPGGAMGLLSTLRRRLTAAARRGRRRRGASDPEIAELAEHDASFVPPQPIPRAQTERTS
jgi:branched-chain amino acid transport system permease protein